MCSLFLFVLWRVLCFRSCCCCCCCFFFFFFFFALVWFGFALILLLFCERRRSRLCCSLACEGDDKKTSRHRLCRWSPVQSAASKIRLVIISGFGSQCGGSFENLTFFLLFFLWHYLSLPWGAWSLILLPSNCKSSVSFFFCSFVLLLFVLLLFFLPCFGFL